MQSIIQSGPSYLDKETGQSGTVWELELVPLYHGSSGDIYRARAIAGPKKGQQGLLKRPGIQNDGGVRFEQIEDIEKELKALKGMLIRRSSQHADEFLWRAMVRVPYLLDWGKTQKGNKSYPFIISEEVQGDSIKDLINQSKLDADTALRVIDGYQRLIQSAHEEYSRESIVYNDAQAGHLFWQNTIPPELVVLDWGNALFVTAEQRNQSVVEKDWQQFIDLINEIILKVQDSDGISAQALHRLKQNITNGMTGADIRRQINNEVSHIEDSIKEEKQRLEEILAQGSAQDAKKLYHLYRSLISREILADDVKQRIHQWPRKQMVDLVNDINFSKKNSVQIFLAYDVLKEYGDETEADLAIYESVISNFNESNISSFHSLLKACLDKRFDDAISIAKRNGFRATANLLSKNNYLGSALKDQVSHVLSLIINRLGVQDVQSHEYLHALEKVRKKLEEALDKWGETPQRGLRHTLYVIVQDALQDAKSLPLNEPEIHRTFLSLQNQATLLQTTLDKWRAARFKESEVGFSQLAISDPEQPYFATAKSAIPGAVNTYNWIIQRLNFIESINENTLKEFRNKTLNLEEEIENAEWIQSFDKELEILINKGEGFSNSNMDEGGFANTLSEQLWDKFDVALQQGDYATARIIAEDLATDKVMAEEIIEGFEYVENGRYDMLDAFPQVNNPRLEKHLVIFNILRSWYSSISIKNNDGLINAKKILLSSNKKNEYAVLQTLYKRCENAEWLNNQLAFIDGNAISKEKPPENTLFRELYNARNTLPISKIEDIRRIAVYLGKAKIKLDELITQYDQELILLNRSGLRNVDAWLLKLRSQCTEIITLFEETEPAPKKHYLKYSIYLIHFVVLSVLSFFIIFSLRTIDDVYNLKLYYFAGLIVMLLGYYFGNNTHSVDSKILSKLQMLVQQIASFEKDLAPLNEYGNSLYKIEKSESLENAILLAEQEKTHPLRLYVLRVIETREHYYFWETTLASLLLGGIVGLFWVSGSVISPLPSTVPHQNTPVIVDTPIPSITPTIISSATPLISTATFTPSPAIPSPETPTPLNVTGLQQDPLCTQFDTGKIAEKFRAFIGLKQIVLSNNQPSNTISCTGRTLEQLRQEIYLPELGGTNEKLLYMIQVQPNIDIMGKDYFLYFNPRDKLVYWLNDDQNIPILYRQLIETQNNIDIARFELMLDAPTDAVGNIFTKDDFIHDAGYGIMFSANEQKNYTLWVEWKPDRTYNLWLSELQPDGALVNSQAIEVPSALVQRARNRKDINILVEYSGQEIKLYLNDFPLVVSIPQPRIHRTRIGIYGYNNWDKGIKLHWYRLNMYMWEIK